ncbi:hypothetical protein EXS54_01620 [Patescibacteria group bacterium]|nr:hypothetical protein [Patescibacteria group bacterium]
MSTKVLAVIGLCLAIALGVAIGISPIWAIVVFLGLLLFAAYVLVLLRYPERGLWLLAVGLPYERLGALPLGFFTLKFGHVVTLFIVLSLTARTVITKTVSFAYNPLRIPLLLLLAASILSLVNAVDLVRGVALIGQLLVGFLVYFVVVNLLSRPNLSPTIVALWVGSGLVALFGLYQFVGDFAGLPPSVTGLVPSYSGAAAFGFARITGTSLEPLYFANYLLLPLLIGVSMLFYYRGKKRFWLSALLFLIFIVFVLTLARGAYLGLGAGLLLVLIRYYRSVFQPKVLLGAGAVIIITFTMVVGLLVQTTNGAEQPLQAFTRQLQVTGTDVSSKQRIGTVEAAADLVKDHPLVGIGIGNFGNYYQDPLTVVSEDKIPQTVHNQPLETLVETGIFGLLALLAVGFVLLERTIRAWKRVRGKYMTAALVGSAAAVIAILVQAQTFSAIYLMHAWFAIGMLVGIQNLILNPRKAAQ